jgi:hypothetical protein
MMAEYGSAKSSSVSSSSGGECCCVGTSTITTDPVTNEENDETCLEITELGPEEECDGDIIAKPDSAESCGGAFAVIEWCDLSVTLDCDTFAEEQFETRVSENFPFNFPPFLCTVDEANITQISLFASFAPSLANNFFPSFSDCSFGCGQRCDRCVIRFAFALYDGPGEGAVKARYYYVTQRSGCDESPIIENIYDQGNYCCPEEAEVTITFAP